MDIRLYKIDDIDLFAASSPQEALDCYGKDWGLTPREVIDEGTRVEELTDAELDSEMIGSDLSGWVSLRAELDCRIKLGREFPCHFAGKEDY